MARCARSPVKFTTLVSSETFNWASIADSDLEFKGGALRQLKVKALERMGNNRTEAAPPNTLNTTVDYSSRLMRYTIFDNNSGSMYLYVANAASQTLLIQVACQIPEHV